MHFCDIQMQQKNKFCITEVRDIKIQVFILIYQGLFTANHKFLFLTKRKKNEKCPMV